MNNINTEANFEIEEIVDQVEKLPRDEQELVYRKLEVYHGDLPHPDILSGYNQLYADAAKRIIENGIAETEHRRVMETTYLKQQAFAHVLGQIFGFIVALCIIFSGVYLVLNNHPITGTILTGASAIGVIGLFTGNNQNQNKE